MAVEIASIGRPRKLPRQLPRTSVVIAALSWQISADGRGNCHGSFRGFQWVAIVGTMEFATGRTAATCRGHNRGICRGSAMTRCTCRENPRISTVVRGNTHRNPREFRGQCHGPPPKSQIMCIRDFMLHTTSAWLCNVASITRRRGCACPVMRA